MKLKRTLILAVVLAACQYAEFARGETETRVETEAALQAARADLRNQIAAIYLSAGFTIGDVLKSDPAALDIDKLIARAEPLGRPRWIGEDVVQVKLMLPPGEIASAVKSSRGSSSMLQRRLEPHDMDRFARDWQRRSLQASGQAIPAARIAQVVTTLQRPAWIDVPDSERASTALQARHNATVTLVEQVQTIRTSPTQSLGTAMPEKEPALTAWADTMPATRIELRDDRQIEIGVYVDKAGLGDVLQSQQTATKDEQGKAIAIGIGGLPDTIVGRAVLTSAVPLRLAPAMVIRDLPAWANDPITAEADATFLTTQLRTARAAERSARDALREKLLAEKIGGEATLAQRARQEPRITAAIDAAVAKARVYEVDYHADGSATVRVSLDPNELLDSLNEPR